MSQRWQAVAADSVQFLDHSTESPVALQMLTKKLGRMVAESDVPTIAEG